MRMTLRYHQWRPRPPRPLRGCAARAGRGAGHRAHRAWFAGRLRRFGPGPAPGVIDAVHHSATKLTLAGAALAAALLLFVIAGYRRCAGEAVRPESGRAAHPAGHPPCPVASRRICYFRSGISRSWLLGRNRCGQASLTLSGLFFGSPAGRFRKSRPVTLAKPRCGDHGSHLGIDARTCARVSSVCNSPAATTVVQGCAHLRRSHRVAKRVTAKEGCAVPPVTPWCCWCSGG
jgi:hypothetical protein